MQMVLQLKKENFLTNDELGFFYVLTDAVYSVSDPDELFFILLTAATAGSGLGFSRAALFLRDAKDNLVGKMGIGPDSVEEADTIWSRLAQDSPSLSKLFSGYSDFQIGNFFNQKIISISLPAGDNDICSRVLRNGETYLLTRPYEKDLLPEVLGSVFISPQVVVTPIPGRYENAGILVGGNAFSGQAVSERQAQRTAFLALAAGNIIEKVKTNQKLSERLEELEEAYHDLYQMRQRLLSSERLAHIGEAIAYVSHEIREPLSVIGGLANIIGRGCGENQDVKSQSGLIYQKAMQLNRFVNRNLAFAGLREQEKEFCRPVELVKGVVEEIVKGMVVEGRTPVKIEERFNPETPMVLVDPERLKHALTNVLENSIYFVAGLPDGKVVLTSEWDERFVRLVIADNGIGIPETNIERVFEPFFTTRSGGNGLGLVFARQIIETAGGRITVESKGKKEGAIFTVSLPRD
jgi:signal transduction histidine kinase